MTQRSLYSCFLTELPHSTYTHVHVSTHTHKVTGNTFPLNVLSLSQWSTNRRSPQTFLFLRKQCLKMNTFCLEMYKHGSLHFLLFSSLCLCQWFSCLVYLLLLCVFMPPVYFLQIHLKLCTANRNMSMHGTRKWLKKKIVHFYSISIYYNGARWLCLFF